MQPSPTLLIIGQGIAGTVLALTALERGYQVTCVDLGDPAIATRAAAGILNPVTGPRLNLSWQVHTLMPAAKAFYQHWENQLNTAFFSECTIRRLFRTEAEITYHTKRYRVEENRCFLGDWAHPEPIPHQANSRLGECAIRAAVLDIPNFLDSTRRWLKTHSTLRIEPFVYSDVTLEPETASVNWQGNRYDHVIFCEGYGVHNNPWFSSLPFKPAKGESLEVELTYPLAAEVLSAEKWILPLGGCHALTGSTYVWEPLDNTCTAEGRDQLLQGIATMLPDNPVKTVLAHRAGVRPCSHNTRPYVGKHPEHRQLCILNGLGSKGTLMAPSCAAQLLDHLKTNAPLNPDLDIQRVRIR